MKVKFTQLALVVLFGIASASVMQAANQPPALTANNPLYLDQGSSAVITSDLLGASDAESPASQITFTVAPNGNGGPPHNGWLRIDGTNLIAGSAFTQDDINQGRLSYQHNDNNETLDDFQFDVSDPNGNNIPGAPYMAYSFKISITLINHAPVAQNSVGESPWWLPVDGQFVATDRDIPAQALTYRIVTNGAKGTATITDPNTGAFHYVANPGEVGLDTVWFQVNDGTVDALIPGNFVITLKPLLAQSTSYNILESAPYSGILPATNATPSHPLTYRLATNGSLGTVVITDTNTGAFTYSPTPGIVGADRFSFIISDGTFESGPAICTVRIQPIFEPGDFIVTEINSHSLIYVDRSTLRFSMLQSGGMLSVPKSCTFTRAGQILVMDTQSGVVRINPTNGIQTLVCSGTNFSGNMFGAMGIVEEPSGNLLVADGPYCLMRVNPETGVATNLSSGGNLLMTTGVAVTTNGDIYVADAAGVAGTGQPSRILRIDPVTGAQTVISSGTNLVFPVGIAVESANTLIVGDAAGFMHGHNMVLRIDIATGAQTVVSQEGNLSAVVGLGVDDLGNILTVNMGNAKIVSMDPISGEQTVLLAAPTTTSLIGLAVARDKASPDSDSDGLPDWWEQHFFPYVGAQPAEDLDGDHMSNLSEYKAGTSPVNALSALKLSLQTTTESVLTLGWSSVQNRQYTLERAAVLSSEPGAFTLVQTGIKATAPTNSLLITNGATGGNYFYRLRLEE
jgi:sugar lactone lactonase YvrE